MDQLWKQVLEEVQVEVSPPRFTAFFKSTQLVSLTDGVATIGTPNPMNTDLLEKNYYSLIKNALEKKTGGKISLIFTVKRVAPEIQKDAGPLFSEKVLSSVAKKRPARIREDYTFDSLAVADSNQLAYTAAKAVLEHPGALYNPLFIYGQTGHGKTHLTQAIGNHFKKIHTNKKVIYITSEKFAVDYINSVRNGTANNFKNQYRQYDVLIMDDIQFIASTEKNHVHQALRV